MPLKTGPAPQNGLTVVTEALHNLTASPNQNLFSERSADSNETEVTAPIQVFTLKLDDIQQQNLQLAYPTGWRYVVLNDGEPVSAAEINSSANEETQFSHFNTGPFVEEVIKTVIEAENLPQVQQNDYEVRLLKIPALYVMALWLHGNFNDILIPMPPTNDQLEAGKTYSPDELLSSLSPAAESRAAFDERPDENAY